MNIRTPFLLVALLLPFGAWADENFRYQDWVVQKGVNNIEAFTRSGNNATFGFFCKVETCVFYINLNASCPVNAKNPVLMSAGGVSSAFMATCTKLNGHYFQLLDDPGAVNQAIKSSSQIGFSMALQGGDFFVAKFSLDNAKIAIERVIFEAKQKKPQINGPLNQMISI